MVPTEPISCDSDWVCSSCNGRLSAEEVRKTLEQIKDPRGKAEWNESDRDMRRILELEERLFKAGEQLGPNNCVILSTEYELLKCYSQLEPELSRTMRQRIVQMCLHILPVIRTLDPGPSKLKGFVLEKFVVSYMHVTKADYAAQIINRKQFNLRVAIAMKALNEAMQCLRIEVLSES